MRLSIQDQSVSSNQYQDAETQYDAEKLNKERDFSNP
jgi:hypothetical protein